MKPFALPLVALLLAGCTAAPAATPTATPTQSGSTPTPTKLARTFTTQEEALLTAGGWSKSDPALDDFLTSAHSLCATFDGVTDEEIFEAMRQSPTDKKVTGGQIMTLLCDDSARYMPIVVAVDMPEARASGTYYVGDGDGGIKPGDYRTIGAATDCYWVRKDKSGDIIDNDLVKSAPGGVRLTVKKSDYEVTLQQCGIWIPS